MNSNRFGLAISYQSWDGQGHRSDFVLLPVLTTGYVAQSYTAVVPSAATWGFAPRFMSLQLVNNWVSSAGNVTIDLDDVTLELSP